MGDFLKDKASVTVIFFATIFAVLLYIRLSFGKDVEILYPVLIAIAFYIVYMLTELNKYIMFNKSLKRTKAGSNEVIPAYDAQQRLIAEVIKQINSDSIRKVNELENHHKNWRIFISQWIHNLKTPATVIDLAIQKVKLDQCNIDCALDIIEEERNKIFNSLDNILNIIRLDDFSKDYCPETVNLHTQLNEIINNSKNAFIYNHVYPVMKVEPKTMILTDRKWNRVLLEQIISNAIKYSSSRDQDKTVTFKVENSKEHTILIIEDQGIGIPDYDINRIFEPFFTGQNGRNVKNSSGIGLFIAKTISDKLGHNIKIRSTPGEGTTVIISYLTKL